MAASEVAELVLRARRGDPTAFDELVRRHLRAAYVVALAVLGRPADADDIAQEAFVTALERLEDCRDPARFSGWLLQIVRNRAKHALDKRRLRDSAGEPTDVAVPGPTSDVVLRAHLLAALAKHPTRRSPHATASRPTTRARSTSTVITSTARAAPGPSKTVRSRVRRISRRHRRVTCRRPRHSTRVTA